MFLIAEAWPEEKRVSLLETAGVALLFGAAREMILTVTGRGPWPPLLLNTFTFAPHSDTKPAETCSLPDKTAYLENDATKQKITKLKKLTRSAKK